MTADDPRAAIARFVDQAFAALDRASYYQILGVAPEADSETVRAGYYRLVSRLHPDLHGGYFTAEQGRKLTSVYSRVVEAYRVLSVERRRKEYDRQLAAGALRYDVETAALRRQRRPEDELHPNAKKFFKLGQEALGKNDVKSAIMNLRMALSVEPESPLLRAALKRAEDQGKGQGQDP